MNAISAEYLIPVQAYLSVALIAMLSSFFIRNTGPEEAAQCLFSKEDFASRLLWNFVIAHNGLWTVVMA